MMTSPTRKPKSTAGPPRVRAAIWGRPVALSNMRRTPMRPGAVWSLANTGSKGCGLVEVSGGGVAWAEAKAGRKLIKQAATIGFMVSAFLFGPLISVIGVL